MNHAATAPLPQVITGCLLALPVLLPLLGAALALLAGRRPRTQRAVSLGALGTVALCAATLMWVTQNYGTQTLWLADWPDAAGIVLVADRFSALMLLVASLVTLAVLIYSTGQDEDERRNETPVSIFHPTFLLLAAGVANAFLAGDLFNMYVGFEMLLFASYVLATMGATRSRIRSGAIYVVVSLVSSALFLILLAVVYAATGTVNLASLAQRLAALPGDMQLMIQALALTVFGIKAAVFPLAAWLPDSYPTAPAPVTAVFAGLLTKVGVYAIARTQTLLFPHSPLTRPLLILAAASMLVGILGAIAQGELKRLLSFTLVSHVGYMILGIALATQVSLAAAIYYTAHHITIQTVLFLVAGLVGRVGGSTDLAKISGLATASPVLALLFGIGALNLGGIPPLSGFIGKMALMYAGAQVGGPLVWAALIVAVIVSLLTAYAMAKVWNRAFWGPLQRAGRREGGAPQAAEGAQNSGQTAQLTRVRMPAVMVGATAGLITVSLMLTVAAGPLWQYCMDAAAGMLSSDYVTVVLGGGQ